jgi:4a-hydroxytetrahydrobiopterin dehydratase
MNQLSQQVCEACRGDASRVNEREQASLLAELDDWRVVDEEDIPQLVKAYNFADFANAIIFTNKVGELAEAAGHHPAILTEWGCVTVRWWTHKIKGLHKNDFIMAAKTDDIV